MIFLLKFDEFLIFIAKNMPFVKIFYQIFE